jgi:hypothetical protein
MTVGSALAGTTNLSIRNTEAVVPADDAFGIW